MSQLDSSCCLRGCQTVAQIQGIASLWFIPVLLLSAKQTCPKLLEHCSALWRILSFCCVTLCCFNSEIHINTVVLHLFCKRQGQLGLHWCHWGSCLQADVGQQCWWTLPSVFLLHVAVSLLRRVPWARRKRHKTSGFRNWSCSSFLRWTDVWDWLRPRGLESSDTDYRFSESWSISK